MCLIYNIVTLLFIDLVKWEQPSERRKAPFECSEQPINQFAWHGAMWSHLNQMMIWGVLCLRCCVPDSVCSWWVARSCVHTQHSQLRVFLEPCLSPGRKAEPPFPPSPSCCDWALVAGCFHGSAAGIPFPLSIPGAPRRVVVLLSHRAPAWSVLVLLWRLLWDNPHGWEGAGGPLGTGTGNLLSFSLWSYISLPFKARLPATLLMLQTSKRSK